MLTNISRYLPWRRQTGVPDPKTLISEPSLDVVVKRQHHDLVIQWRIVAASVHVYAGTAPDAIDETVPLAEVSGENQVVIRGLDTAVRYYFAVVFTGGPVANKRLVAAERILPLTGAVNMRDLGGYETEDGRATRWGLVYRSGILHYLTGADRRYLDRLGIKLVCDLRARTAGNKRPNGLLDEAEKAHYPIESDNFWVNIRGIRRAFFRPDRLGETLLDAYTKVIIDNYAPVIGRILQHLASDEHLPALIHCTAGKDRTGIVTALLLRLLGVPDETIIADYTLSNLYVDQFRASTQTDIRPLAPIGLTVDTLQPLLVAHPQTMKATLAYIREKYGSVMAYLCHTAGVDNTTTTRLREQLLT